LDGYWVAISVQDTGVGISKQDLPRIFERFYRVDKSRSGAKGSGLGLAIAEEIVEAYGGTIGVRSQVNRGTCFSILLPVT
jgi:signal transduction histidine kinase